MTLGTLTWTARALAAVQVLVYGFAVAAILGAAPVPTRPFVLPGAPFGTYAENTQLGLITLTLAFALCLVGALLAFRWESLATKVLVAGGLVHILLAAFSWNDVTRPDGRTGLLMALLLFAGPPIVTALLLGVVARDKGSAATVLT